MNCEEFFESLIKREELADIPVLDLIRVSIVAFDELQRMARESLYSETFRT